MKFPLFFSIILLFNICGQTPAPSADGQTMTTKFKVYGNCGMCEKRIEKAAKINGVSSAEWSDETLLLTVTFDEKVVKPNQIHAAVAAIGHDTDKVRADDAVYAKLHECCQYERPAKQ
jgi:copper chaperone CopZ